MLNKDYVRRPRSEYCQILVILDKLRSITKYERGKAIQMNGHIVQDKHPP